MVLNYQSISYTTDKLEIDLEQYVESKYENDGPGITEIECKSIIKDLMHKLSILHENGYIHRDIKAENIMANKNGEWYFIDYDVILYIGDKYVGNKKKLLNLYDGPFVVRDIKSDVNYKISRLSDETDLAVVHVSKIRKVSHESRILHKTKNTNSCWSS